jgi:ATP phosphoribosyltransferase regulatory subunit
LALSQEVRTPMTQTAVPTSSYPVGVRALLPEEARRRRSIESAIVGALQEQRFEEIVLPIIDFVEAYSDVLDRDVQRRSYRFTDREGELITIRSDFTPMVARALAPSLGRTALPLRVFYRGDVIRCDASRLGTNREFFQIGAEMIGDGSVDADFTMLELAVRIVSSFGIQPVVVLTDSSLATRLVEAAAQSAADRQAIRSALANKRAAELETLGGRIDADLSDLFHKIATGRATLADLAGRPETAGQAARLGKLQRRADRIEGAKVVLAVDDIDEEPGYYTGVRFRLFAPRSRMRLAQGGRYDALYSRFGAQAEAIGFTLTVDYLDAEIGPNGAAEGTP